MKLLTIAVAALFVGALSADIIEDEGVLVLNKDNFDQALADNKYILVLFYSPSCPHSKALAPEYAKVAQELAGENSEIKLAKVDATKETELKERFEVTGYPTIEFFRNGKSVDYSGGHTFTDIIAWLKKKTGPPAALLDTTDAAKDFIEKNDVAVMGFFKVNTTDAAKIFLDVAAEKEDLAFGITSDADVFKAYNIEGESIVLFKKIDDERIDLKTDDLDATKLKNFIAVNRYPVMLELTQDTEMVLFEGDIKSHLLLFISKRDDGFETLIDEFRKAAEQFKGKEVLFFYINIEDEDNRRVLEYFGLQVSDCPLIRFIHLGEEELIKYKPETNDLDSKNMQAFVQNVLDGKVKRHLMSEDVPSDWNVNPVKVLVGKNFVEVAMDKTKAVFVEFYAPWCDYCKQLAPIWEELGEKFKDRDDIIIAKMDGTKNEPENVKIPGFPTLKYFGKDDNKEFHYGGEKTLEEFTAFLEYMSKGPGAPADEVEVNKEEDAVEKDEL